jgi:hypothetical protein
MSTAPTELAALEALYMASGMAIAVYERMSQSLYDARVNLLRPFSDTA